MGIGKCYRIAPSVNPTNHQKLQEKDTGIVYCVDSVTRRKLGIWFSR